MKFFLVLFFCFAFSLHSDPSQEMDDDAAFNQSQNLSNEIIAADDLNFLGQQPISRSAITPPAPILPVSYKNSSLAAGLSALIPGLGHVYLNDMKTAVGFLGSTGVGVGLALSMPSNHNAVSTSGLMFVQNTWLYGVYAAYRDARLFNGSSAYSYPMPTEQITDLAYAPFQWSVLKKPEVWGGILGALAVGIGTVYFAFPDEAHIRLDLSSTTEMPFLALPIGIGEESFFRGYLQSTLSESCTPWGGITLSSLAFGAAHIQNAIFLESKDRWRYYAFSLPVITSVGAYFGWLTYKNHSLKESVAVHTWYDFIIMTAGALANYKASAGKTGFALAIPF